MAEIWASGGIGPAPAGGDGAGAASRAAWLLGRRGDRPAGLRLRRRAPAASRCCTRCEVAAPLRRQGLGAALTCAAAAWAAAAGRRHSRAGGHRRQRPGPRRSTRGSAWPRPPPTTIASRPAGLMPCAATRRARPLAALAAERAHATPGTVDRREPACAPASPCCLIAYVFSQFYRAFLAVLAPVLATDIGATAADLAFASGVWFAVFAAMQIPVGHALDTHRPAPHLRLAVRAGGGRRRGLRRRDRARRRSPWRWR